MASDEKENNGDIAASAFWPNEDLAISGVSGTELI
jgi:hypothetical protein